MALRKSEIFRGETVIQSAGSFIPTGAISEVEKSTYCKVSNITGTKDAIMLRLQVIDESSGVELAQKEFVFAPDMAGGNFIRQAYDHLKTLPEFDGAVDC